MIKSNLIAVKEKLSDKQMGIIMMVFASFAFAIMGIAVKLSGDIPIYEKVFFRNGSSILFAYYLVKKNGATCFGSKGNRLLLNIRSIFGILGVVTMFYALDKINVATAMTIKNFSQFWVLILAGIFLKERVRPGQFFFMCIALVGVVIVSKPSAPSVWFPTFICFMSSLFSGVAFTAISKLKGKEHPTTVVFYFSLMTTVIMAVPTLFQFRMLTPYEFVLMLLTGFSAMAGQSFMTLSYHYTSASEVSIYAYLSIVFSAIMAIFIWKEIPDLLNILGMVLIVASSYMSSRQKNGNKEEPSPI